MRFFMPPTKTKIQLTRDFRIEVGRWEKSLFEDNELVDPIVQAVDINNTMGLLPEGTVLELTKVYIRNDGYGSDSLNLKIISTPQNNKINGRSKTITLPMEIANTLDFELFEEEDNNRIN